MSGLLPALALLCLATPAVAEIGASISAQSDARFRGRSLSRGRPTASLALSYDGTSGFYVGGSATGVATAHSGVRYLGVQGNIGFAHPIAKGLVLDIGVDHARYSEYYSSGHHARYSEFYAGLVGRNLSSHVYYSPDYFGLGFATLYGEIDGVVRASDKWRLNGHVGAITRLDGEGPVGYDWRIGVSRRIGAFDLQAAFSGGGPMPQYYGNRAHHRDALTIGLSYIL